VVSTRFRPGKRPIAHLGPPQGQDGPFCNADAAQASLARTAAADAEAQAFLDRLAAQKRAEAKRLAGLTVAQLRRAAARLGVRGTRTMRRAELLLLLTP
jgi:hypothetical protein